jgi:multidrug efflux pump subunit AcrB
MSMMRKPRLLPLTSLVAFLVLGGFLAVLAFDPPQPGQAEPRPTITVEAVYPGANAQTVADIVAAPIEQQLNGVEGMHSLISHCTNDGACVLTVAFKPGTQLNLALVLVQNRVNLALSVLPELVKQSGVSVKNKSPNAFLFVKAFSPDGSRDALFLNTQAAQFRDELTRLPGVGDVVFPGSSTSESLLNGKPVVLLAVHPRSHKSLRELSDALEDQLTRIRKRLPRGMDIACDFNFGLENGDRPPRSEYLLLNPTLSAMASKQRRLAVLKHCQGILGDMKGVQDVLALTENPFHHSSDQLCILVRLAPASQRKATRAEIAQDIRTRLEVIKGMTLRLRDLSGESGLPRFGYPIDLAVHGPETDQVRQFAARLSERLSQHKRLTDVWANSDSRPRPWLVIDVDRKAAATQGVSLQDVFKTLQVVLGELDLTELQLPGNTVQVTIQSEDRLANRAEDVRKLKVRNAKGEMVALSAFTKLREIEGVTSIDRFNLEPMVEITANPAVGASLGQVRATCETLAEDVRKELRLSNKYRLTWLHDLPAPE